MVSSLFPVTSRASLAVAGARPMHMPSWATSWLSPLLPTDATLFAGWSLRIARVTGLAWTQLPPPWGPWVSGHCGGGGPQRSLPTVPPSRWAAGPKERPWWPVASTSLVLLGRPGLPSLQSLLPTQAGQEELAGGHSMAERLSSCPLLTTLPAVYRALLCPLASDGRPAGSQGPVTLAPGGLLPLQARFGPVTHTRGPLLLGRVAPCPHPGQSEPCSA